MSTLGCHTVQVNPQTTYTFLVYLFQGIFTLSSNYLHRATDGRAYFHQVEIIVPPNWDTASCGRSLPVGAYTSRGTMNEAAIRIGTEHPVFGSKPWTQQSRGCGLSGDYISVGYHYILQVFNSFLNYKWKSMTDFISSSEVCVCLLIITERNSAVFHFVLMELCFSSYNSLKKCYSLVISIIIF